MRKKMVRINRRLMDKGGVRGPKRTRHGRGRIVPRQGRRMALHNAIAIRKESSPCKVLPAEGLTAATLFDSLSVAQKGKLADLQDALSKMWD
jgi:hypothetical protein